MSYPPPPPPQDPGDSPQYPHDPQYPQYPQQPPSGGYPQPPYPGYPPGYGQPYGAHPQAPYGYDPISRLPYSDKSKLAAGLLQLLIPLGIGRMYIGDVTTGVIQLVVTLITCGVGAIWPFIDGILILTGRPKDSRGLPLRPG